MPVTRGHQADFEVLRQALLTRASYVGVIGSRSKIATTNKRLLEAGIPETELCRIHAPIGLPIGAISPGEVAVAIMAQITAQFEPNPPIEPIVIINLIQKNRNYKLAGQDKLSLTRNCPTLADRVAAVKELMRQLKP